MKKIRLFTGLILYTYFITVIVGYALRNSGIYNHPRWIPKSICILIGEVSNNPKNIWNELTSGEYRSFLENTEINDGFTYFEKDKPIDSLLILTSYELGRHQVEVVLYDVNNNKTIKKWEPPMKLISDLSHVKIGDNERFRKGEPVFLWHPLLCKDSSIIVHTHYSLARINSNSEIEWVKNNYETHHSIEQGPDGFIWISGRRHKTELKGLIKDEDDDLKFQFRDDLIMKIDPLNGEVLYEKSVIEILKENNIDDLMYSDGQVISDPIHLNDVQPAMYDGDFWKKGDLLVSCRNISTLLLYRASSNKVLWYKQGPWLSQHDGDFYQQDKIVIFGNQVFGGGFYNGIESPSDYNSVFVYDFKKDTIYEPFKKMIEKNNIMTRSEGRCDILPNGDIFIEEQNNARILIGDSINKKVEFVKRINDEYIIKPNWSRIILK
jgi:hypothetical protein